MEADIKEIIDLTKVKYKSVKSFLRITGDVNAGEPLKEKVINQILMAIDTRIERDQ
jgi:hypothetical protein